MKKAKIAFWGILIAFVALQAYQNWDFIMSTHGLKINLLVKEYHTPELQNIILFLIFFFAGLLISYFFSLLDRFAVENSLRVPSDVEPVRPAEFIVDIAVVHIC